MRGKPPFPVRRFLVGCASDNIRIQMEPYLIQFREASTVHGSPILYRLLFPFHLTNFPFVSSSPEIRFHVRGRHRHRRVCLLCSASAQAWGRCVDE